MSTIRISFALLLAFPALIECACGGPPPTVPPGFTVELVAGPEHVQHPMMACFDDRGRLYVCESAGTNRKAAELVADPQDSIRVLEDTDHDGRFDKSWTFADKLVFPQGCLWYRGAVYTCSSPYLWKLEDTDGDGVCDQRTVLVKSFGFSGNAADIHGPFLSPDGRLYWCDGRHGHEIRDLGDGQVGGDDDAADVKPDPEPGLPNAETGELLTRGKAARIFSCRPDGSDLRVLCGGGMDNPVELDFWETGEVLGTVNLFYGKPRGDCLVHWVEGGVYPKQQMRDCIAEFPWTGGLLDPVTNYGHVAVSGLCRYRSNEFGDLTQARAAQSRDRQEAVENESSVQAERELADSGDLVAARRGTLPHGRGSDGRGADARAAFFVTQFNTHKLVKSIVERHGSTFRVLETTDFLVSDNPDFHPTDVLEDADGSLLLIDTGGWFRIGCPTSQVAKPEIGGAIYRIRKVGAHRIDDPRGLAIAWNSVKDDPIQLSRLLGDDRPAVRERAIEAVAGILASDQERGVHFCQTIDSSGTLHERIGFLAAVARAGRSLLAWHYIQSDPEPAVRLAALAACPGPDALDPGSGVEHLAEQVLARVASPHPDECRLALESLTPLLQLEPGLVDTLDVHDVIAARLGGADIDRTLEHAAVVALTRIADSARTRSLLGSSDPRVQRVALIALDQMPGGHLTREQVLPLLATHDAVLRDTVLEVISRRTGWAEETLPLLRTWLAEPLPPDRAEVLRTFLSAQAQDPAVQSFIAGRLTDPALPPAGRSAVLEAIATAGVSEWPDSWTPACVELLTKRDPEQTLQVLRIANSRGLAQFDHVLHKLVEDESQPLSVRVEALAAAAPRLERLTDADHRFVMETLRGHSDLLLRLKAGSAFAAAPLSDEQTASAASAIAALGPPFVPVLWPAFERASSPATQQLIVRSLNSLEELPQVSELQVRQLIDGFSEPAQTDAAPLLARFAARDAEAKARIDRHLSWTKGGDPQRGRYVFFGQTAACSRCHRVGRDGAQIGPDLSKIGAIRQPRDFLESILLPSSSFARDYQSYTAVTSDGRVVSGLISRETPDAIVFRLTDLSEVRVPRETIEVLKESETSIMPQGLETKLTEQEFRDLLAFLQSLN